MELGRKIYAKQCAMCHGDEGKGYPPEYPPLAGNQSITMASPVNPIRMVLNGGYPPGHEEESAPHGMPPFSHILNDEEVAAVVTYIRVAWGNTGTPVAPAAGERDTQTNNMRLMANTSGRRARILKVPYLAAPWWMTSIGYQPSWPVLPRYEADLTRQNANDSKLIITDSRSSSKASLWNAALGWPALDRCKSSRARQAQLFRGRMPPLKPGRRLAATMTAR